MNSSTAIRLGVIGLGAVAQSVHLPLIRRRPELFSLAAVSDISASLVHSVGDAFAVPKVAQFTSVDAMLDHSELDAILICSGGSHEPIVVAALQRGLAVLCEKPLAFTRAELGAIRAALPDGDAPRLMVGYMKQYDPATTRARELLVDIDDLRSVDVTVLHPTGRSQLEFAHLISAGNDVPAEIAERIQHDDRRLRRIALGDDDENQELWRVYAGCLMSSLSHDMSVLRRTTGPVASVDHSDIWRTRSAHQKRETGRDAGGLGIQPPSIRAVGRLSGNTRFLMDWHYLHDYPAYRETVRFVYGSGSLELAFPSPYLLHTPTVLTRYSLDGATEARTEFRSIAEAFEIQLEAFVDMLREGTPPLTDIVGAEQDVATSQAIIARYAHRVGITLGGELATA